jgi:hypothetical protein
MHDIITQLKREQLIWKGGKETEHQQTLSTGFPELDQKLHGGFPTHGVVEIQSIPGIGEFRLLTPHIQHAANERLLVLINPPGYLSADYLHASGIDPQRIRLVYPQTPQHALWAAEQCLKSGACSTVCLWQTQLEVHHTKRLQVASEKGHCLQFLFKSTSEHVISLPVSLSLSLSPHDDGIEVTITKRKGGFPRSRFLVPMSAKWPELALTKPNSTVIPFPLQKQG